MFCTWHALTHAGLPQAYIPLAYSEFHALELYMYIQSLLLSQFPLLVASVSSSCSVASVSSWPLGFLLLFCGISFLFAPGFPPPVLWRQFPLPLGFLLLLLGFPLVTSPID